MGGVRGAARGAAQRDARASGGLRPHRLEGALPATDHLLVVSGRVSFEIVQKAVAAGVAGIVAVSAPSSLAVDLAVEHDLVLAGMVRGGSLNVYAGQRLVN